MPSLAAQDTDIGRVAGIGESGVVDIEVVEDGEVVKTIDDGDADWVLEGAIGLCKRECAVAKRRLRDLQDNCSAKRRKVPTTVAEASNLAKKISGCVVETCGSNATGVSNNSRAKTLEVEMEAAWGETNLAKAREKN